MLHGFRFQPPKWSVLTLTLEYNGKASLCLIPDSCFLFMWASLTVSRPDSAPAAPLRSVFSAAPRRRSAPADWQYLFTGGGTQGETRGGKPYCRQHERSFSYFQPIPTPISESKPYTGVSRTDLSGCMGRPDTRWMLLCWLTWKIKTQRGRDARTLTHFRSIVLEAKALGEYPDLYWALDALNLHRRVWMFNIRGRWLFCQFKSRKSFFCVCTCIWRWGDAPFFLAVHETTCGITPIFCSFPQKR